MATKTKIPIPDPVFPHVSVGPSNEELRARYEREEAERIAKGYPKVEFLADAEDKATDGFGDIDYDPLGLSDPLLALKRKYQRPGFALKLLSDGCCSHLGRRGYQTVVDERGDPVTSGKMVLGEIPEALAARRRAAPIREAKEQLGSITDAQREAVEKMKSDAKGMGLTFVGAGETVKNVGDGQTYDMGLTVDRGEAPPQP
jgi:hypothetical protein